MMLNATNHQEMQIKITVISHLNRYDGQCQQSKAKQKISGVKNMEKSEPTCIVGGNVTWCSCCGKLHGGFQKIKNRITMQL